MTLKKLIALSFSTLLSITSTAAFAVNSTATGHITMILSGPGFGTKVFISTDATVNNPMPCSTNPQYSYVLDSSEPGANVWISMLTVAYTTGKPMYLEGMQDDCTLYPNVERLKYLRLNP